MPRKYTLCKVEGKHLTFRQRQIVACNPKCPYLGGIYSDRGRRVA